MTFYSGLESVATRLLSEKGQERTFTRKTNHGYDTQSSTPTISESTYTSSCVITENMTSTKSDTVIKKYAAKMLMEAANAPEVGDTVSIDGKNLRVSSFDKIAPANTVLAYKVELKL